MKNNNRNDESDILFRLELNNWLGQVESIQDDLKNIFEELRPLLNNIPYKTPDKDIFHQYAVGIGKLDRIYEILIEIPREGTDIRNLDELIGLSRLFFGLSNSEHSLIEFFDKYPELSQKLDLYLQREEIQSERIKIRKIIKPRLDRLLQNVNFLHKACYEQIREYTQKDPRVISHVGEIKGSCEHLKELYIDLIGSIKGNKKYAIGMSYLFHYQNIIIGLMTYYLHAHIHRINENDRGILGKKPNAEQIYKIFRKNRDDSKIHKLISKFDSRNQRNLVVHIFENSFTNDAIFQKRKLILKFKKTIRESYETLKGIVKHFEVEMDEFSCLGGISDLL